MLFLTLAVLSESRPTFLAILLDFGKNISSRNF